MLSQGTYSGNFTMVTLGESSNELLPEHIPSSLLSNVINCLMPER